MQERHYHCIVYSDGEIICHKYKLADGEAEESTWHHRFEGHEDEYLVRSTTESEARELAMARHIAYMLTREV